MSHPEKKRWWQKQNALAMLIFSKIHIWNAGGANDIRLAFSNTQAHESFGGSTKMILDGSMICISKCCLLRDNRFTFQKENWCNLSSCTLSPSNTMKSEEHPNESFTQRYQGSRAFSDKVMHQSAAMHDTGINRMYMKSSIFQSITEVAKLHQHCSSDYM